MTSSQRPAEASPGARLDRALDRHRGELRQRRTVSPEVSSDELPRAYPAEIVDDGMTRHSLSVRRELIPRAIAAGAETSRPGDSRGPLPPDTENTSLPTVS